jgi:hypothetical protein
MVVASKMARRTDSARRFFLFSEAALTLGFIG